MRAMLFAGLLGLAVVGNSADLMAHGGQYRGPGDVVPPNAGGAGRQPGPNGPHTAGPAGPGRRGPTPVTPGSGPPGSGVPGSAGFTSQSGGRTGGASITPDLGRWQFWWEFNRAPYIDLKEAIHAARPVTGSDDFWMGVGRRDDGIDSQQPTERDVLERILPALKRALDSTDDNDIVSSCLVALGKIGMDHDDFEILEVMRPFLSSSNQEIRETAALSMGISQMPEAIEDLVELAKDTPKGRTLCKRSEVDHRTRSFACYGLGLIAHATSNVDSKRKCYQTLAEVLAETTASFVDRNIPVAAINGIRLVRPNPSGGAKHEQLLDDCVSTLWSYYEKETGQGEQQVQAHVPPAIAQLLGRGGDKTGQYKDAFADLLAGKLGKHNNALYQSAVVALGTLCQPEELEQGDKKYSDALLKYSSTGKNEQARYFCLMALGQIGGNRNRNELLKAFDRGSRAMVKPWAAISLGALAFRAAEAAGGKAVVDETIGQALSKEITQIKNPETQAAIAVALGLCKFKQAEGDLMALLHKNKHRDELAGYLCIGLALMDSKRAEPDIRNVVQASLRRPDRLKQAAIALGKLGDKSVTSLLHRMLEDPSKNVAKLSAISSALGFIGDRRTIDPLITMLHDESITELSRAFAAVALGGVADKESLPWNSKIAVDMNYRAAVETLTNGVTGVLDIL